VSEPFEEVSGHFRATDRSLLARIAHESARTRKAMCAHDRIDWFLHSPQHERLAE
jgi:hypothetical protein